ncbi:FAD/NAD(P)-binding oxidoreductase [Robiginitalea sp. M366]|uniref:NAD(P)/FAD-dependent oxidoreductase n=1 Tax=Robiginitalea aestuariiviva TaxID=3036903 RepID=UPI00240D0818|nr:FAD/NAD(P)-binding oxidoreductase [Robiginitalea aestuariiviva]MDG1571850.1 FAD/NAD(P)-binding oxidoreductase [Robiginitalea aestuariiviva]
MHVLIIGNGISGVTAARHIRKNSDCRITLISAETDAFFSRTALMYIYMGHLTFQQTQPYPESFWSRNRMDRIRGYVTAIHPETRSVALADGREIGYDKLILATGSKPNKFGWPGQDLDGVQGLYSYQDLERLEAFAPNATACRRAVVVGGGLIGIELAEMLRSRDIPVTFLVRESSFWNGVLPAGESEMINTHIREHHIDLRLGTNLKEILPDANGRVRAVVTEQGETIPCNLVGLTAGVSPNIDFLRGSGINLGKGVLVNRYLETNLPDIYAVGDCAQQREPIGRRRPVEAVWYTGRMMGETVARTVCGQRTAYTPGHWFNSAKFLDIEYQTYGWVFPEHTREAHEAHFHWRHPKKHICLTLAYDRGSGTLLGVNTFGMRMRHAVLDQWLTEQRTAEYALTHLREALFDPEGYSDYRKHIQTAFRQQTLTAS